MLYSTVIQNNLFTVKRLFISKVILSCKSIYTNSITLPIKKLLSWKYYLYEVFKLAILIYNNKNNQKLQNSFQYYNDLQRHNISVSLLELIQQKQHQVSIFYYLKELL